MQVEKPPYCPQAQLELDELDQADELDDLLGHEWQEAGSESWQACTMALDFIVPVMADLALLTAL